MSDAESNKSGRGKKRRMYQSYDEDTDQNAEVYSESEKTEVQDIPASQTRIENLEIVKFKGSILSSEKQIELNAMIKKNICWTMGVSVVPIPFIDTFLVSSMQLKMVNDISVIYGAKWHEDIGKKYIGSCISSTGYHLGNQLIKSFVKKIPVIGIASVLVSPLLSAATSYALAKVFIYHYELGGNLLDFKPEKMRVYFAKQFEDGKSKLNHMRQDFDFTKS